MKIVFNPSVEFRYVRAVTKATEKGPTMVLQGGRDYQVRNYTPCGCILHRILYRLGMDPYHHIERRQEWVDLDPSTYTLTIEKNEESK